MTLHAALCVVELVNNGVCVRVCEHACVCCIRQHGSAVYVGMVVVVCIP